MKRTQKILVMMSDEDLQKIKKVAHFEGLPLSSFLRRVVLLYSEKKINSDEVDSK